MTSRNEYVKISKGDPGGALSDALAAMSGLTEVVQKDIDARMINERQVFKTLGMAQGEAVMQAIEGNTSIPPRVKSWFKPSEQGVDVLDEDVASVFEGLKQAGIIDGVEQQKLMDYGYSTVPMYPGLTETKIQNARDMKGKGLM